MVIFLLGLVAIALVAGIYLSVTSAAATTGRQIQEMQIRMDSSYRIEQVETSTEETNTQASGSVQEEVIPIEELKIQIADLEAKLAEETSTTVMHDRALQMGFVPTQPDTVTYVRVPESLVRQTAHLAPSPSPVTTNPEILSSAYKESLIDWLSHQLALASRRFQQEVQP